MCCGLLSLSRDRQPHKRVFTQWGVISRKKTENEQVSSGGAAGSEHRFTYWLKCTGVNHRLGQLRLKKVQQQQHENTSRGEQGLVGRQ